MELENCICNQLNLSKPAGRSEFESETAGSNYVETNSRTRLWDLRFQTPNSASVLFKDDKPSTKSKKAISINEMFAGEHPLLMQHSPSVYQ